MNGEKIIVLVNVLFFLSLLGKINRLNYFAIIIWIIALILLFHNTNYKVMKFFYIVLAVFLGIIFVYLLWYSQ